MGRSSYNIRARIIIIHLPDAPTYMISSIVTSYTPDFIKSSPILGSFKPNHVLLGQKIHALPKMIIYMKL